MDLGQVFTNEVVADYMISLFTIDKKQRILDPCFGGGVFIDTALKNGFCNIEGYEIDNVLFDKYREKHSDIRIYNQDFLRVGEEYKYDGIIMNPPYIRQEKIDDLEELGITKRILQENKIYQKLPKTANMYMYFIFKALELLSDDGELVVIFPGSWLQARSGKMFEKAMFQKCTLLKQIEIKGDVFEKNALVDVVILHLKKGVFSYEAEKLFAMIENNSVVEKKHEANCVNIGFNITFADIGKVRRGLTTGCNEMFINPDIKETNFQKIISTPKAVEGYDTRGTKFDKILMLDRNVQLSHETRKYLGQWKDRIISTKAPKTIFEKIQGASEYWYEIKPIESKGIIFSYFVRNDMKFILNEDGYLARDNFYIIYPTINQYIEFALLNNYYTYYQLEKFGKKYGAGLLKLQRYDIENLRFPNVKEFTQEELDTLEKIAKKLAQSGEKELIDEISILISNHSMVEYSVMRELYMKTRERRLRKV